MRGKKFFFFFFVIKVSRKRKEIAPAPTGGRGKKRLVVVSVFCKKPTDSVVSRSAGVPSCTQHLPRTPIRVVASS